MGEIDPADGPVTSSHDAFFSEEESVDSSSAGFDITPRATRAPRSPRGNKFIAIGALVVAAAVLGIVVFKGLNDASMFYYNVDEAVAHKAELGSKRFRMQGNVIDGSIRRNDGGVDFTIAYGDSQVQVANKGNPPELFSPEIPVIIEGSFDGDHFASDEIIIRHDNNYDEKHPERIDDAKKDVNDRSGSAG